MEKKALYRERKEYSKPTEIKSNEKRRDIVIKTIRQGFGSRSKRVGGPPSVHT